MTPREAARLRKAAAAANAAIAAARADLAAAEARAGDRIVAAITAVHKTLDQQLPGRREAMKCENCGQPSTGPQRLIHDAMTWTCSTSCCIALEAQRMARRHPHLHADWERHQPQLCDLCKRVALWHHPDGGWRCNKCPRPRKKV